MGEFFQHLLTGKDNTTYDIGRVALLAGFLLITLAVIANLFLSRPINVVEFATALGGFVTACMLGIAAKGGTEP